MDYHPELTPAIRQLEREVARLRAEQGQFFSKYSPQVAHSRIVKLAQTLEEFDENEESTYPLQGTAAIKSFPIVFVSGGHANEESSAAANFINHDVTAQAFVFSLTHNYIPKSTVIEVWQDIGTETNHPGQWWTVFRDPIRIGVTKVAIDNMANGNVDEYDPKNYAEETDVIETWLCRNWCGYDLEANTPVFFSQRKGVAYIVNAACSASGSGFGSGA